MSQMSLDLEEDKLTDRRSDGRDSYPADDEAIFGYYKDSRGRKVARMIDPTVVVAPEEERAREMRAERRAMRRNPPAPAGQKPGRLILDSSDEGGGLLPPPARQQPVRPAAQQQVPQQAQPLIQQQAVQQQVPQAPRHVAQAPAAPVNKKAGPSRSKFIDGTTEVLDQAVHGLDKFKDVKDGGVALGTDLPNFADALGNAIPGMREGMDNLLEALAPEQQAFQGVAEGISNVHKEIDTLGIKGNPVKTAQAVKLASGLLKIRQYQRNEGKDLSDVNTHEKEDLRDRMLLFQQSRREREGAKLLQNRIGGEGYDPWDAEAAEDHQSMQAEAGGMRKQAVNSMWQRGAAAALSAQRLAKANQKKGVRPLNELSMEKTAYLNDKGFVPQKPLGLFNGTKSKPAFVPKKGMLIGKEAWNLTQAADLSPGANPGDGESDPGDRVQGDEIFRNDPKRRDIDRVNTLNNPEAKRALADSYGDQDYVEPDAVGMRSLTPAEFAARGGDGYREETEEGRAMQKKLKPVDFMAGTGRLLEGTLNTDRMVRDGRYGAAYGAKIADFAVNTGVGQGVKAVQGGLMASAGPLAAPLISIGEAGKKAVLHAKEELGRGVQTGADMIRNQVDPEGLGKAQDNKDTWNAFYGHSRPDVAPEANVDVPDPDAQGGPQDSTETSESFDDLRQDLDEKAALEENDRQVSELKAAQLAGDNVTTNARLRAITPGVANQQRALAGLGDGKGGVDPSRHSGTGSEIEEWARYDDENDRGFQPDPLAAKKLLDVSQDDEGIQPKGDASGFVDTSFRQLIDEAQDDSQSDGLSSISEEDSSQGSDDSQAGQAPEKVSARMDDVLERGYLPEKQGSADVLGRRKRTWGRFAYDNTVGLAGKLLKGVGHGLVGAVKAPFKLAAWGAKGIGWLGKQAWKGMKKGGSWIKSLFTKKAPAPAPKTEEELEAERRQKAQELKAPAVARMQQEGAQQAAAQGVSAADMRRLLSAGVGANPNEKVARRAGDIDLAYQLLRAKVRDARLAGAAGSGPGGGGPGGGGPGGGGPGGGGPGGESQDSDISEGDQGHQQPEDEKQLADDQQSSGLMSDNVGGDDRDVGPMFDREGSIGDRSRPQGGGGQGPRKPDRNDYPDGLDGDELYYLDMSEYRKAGAGQGPGAVDPFAHLEDSSESEVSELRETVVRRPSNPRRSTLMGLVMTDEDVNQVDGPGLIEEEKVGEPEAQQPQRAPVQGRAFMQRGVDGQWAMMEEEEKGAPAMLRNPGVQALPASGQPELLDTSAGGVRRDERLMDPREIAVMANSANPQRAAQRLPELREAVQQAQGAETSDAATAAWRKVDAMQRKLNNRRSVDPIRAADRRMAARRDLMGERMIDVSTSHEGLDLPSAEMPDRRLDTGGDDQFRLPDFEMPGDDFDMFKNRDEAMRLGDDMYDQPADYLPRDVEEHGEKESRRKLFKAYGTMPAQRKQLQARFLDRQREAAAGIDFGTKRVMDGSGSPTADALAHGGEITVDGRPVYPQVPNLDVDANQEFGGAWRRMDTDQVVQTAGLYGAGGRMGAFKGPVDGRNQFAEFNNAPIAEDRVLQAPAEGWDAEPRKPGIFARDRKQKKDDYRQAKQARADVVAQAYRTMRNDRQPAYVRQSAFGRQEWARLETERRAQNDLLRMRLQQGQPHMLMGNMMFGTIPDPKKPKRDPKK